jgi:hypothetical protein
VTQQPWLDTSWLEGYRGASADEAVALAQQQQRQFRIVRPDSAITTDLNKQRLNIVVDDGGSLIGFEAG